VGDAFPRNLQGKRVVVTRSAEQSRELVRALQDAGAVPVVLPMVAFAPPDDTTALDQVLRALSQFDWIFLTSQNALRALQERCHAQHLELPSAFGSARLAAVGPATAEAAASAGIEVSYIATKHHGVALAEELAAEVKGKRVFLPRSDRANPDLVELLNRHGAIVSEVVAYKTVAPDQAVLSDARAALRQPVDAILFFSPSAVHHLQDILGNEKVLELSRQAVFAAIGSITASALHRANVQRVLLAEDTTVKSIVRALENHFGACLFSANRCPLCRDMR